MSVGTILTYVRFAIFNTGRFSGVIYVSGFDSS